MQEIEESVEQYLKRKVEQAGGECVKFSPENKRGWPDRIVILPCGHLIWAELKRPQGGRVSSAQLVAHEDLRRLGQNVVLLKSKEEVDDFLRGF